MCLSPYCDGGREGGSCACFYVNSLVVQTTLSAPFYVIFVMECHYIKMSRNHGLGYTRLLCRRVTLMPRLLLSQG